MPKSHSADQEKALALLQAAFGDFNPEKPLKRIIAGVPDFGAFEWMLTILGLEIDLRVDIPEPLADNHARTAANFCRMVARLPKVDSPGFTLECLGLVAQALLSLEFAEDPAKGPTGKRRAHKAQARGAKSPRTQAASAKRVTRATKRSAAKSRSTSSTKPGNNRRRSPSTRT